MLLLVLWLIPLFAQSQDTICLPAERLGRIADTISYLRQFERYSLISDSAIVECKSFSNALQSQNKLLEGQRNSSLKANELLASQLQIQKEMSESWKQSSSALDKRLQKSKRAGKLWGALFGAAASGGILAGLLLHFIR